MQSILNKLSLQFLCGLPVSELSFPHVNLSLEDQELLLNATVNSDLVLKYPLKIDYQKTVLKHLLDRFEKQGLDIHEGFYCTYGRLVAISAVSRLQYYKHYRIGSSRRVISLNENVHLISEGTTGLRTWQASLALAEWCLNNKKLLFKKNILELGSGIGLAGLVAALECQPNKFFFSDCHPAVIETLCENVKLNCNSLLVNANTATFTSELECRLALSGQIDCGVNIAVLDLPWEDIDEVVCEGLGRIDLILAADIVYDSGLFEVLICALKTISARCQVEDIVFACTERNVDTLETFLRQIGRYFKVSEEDCPSQKNLIWSSSPPVRIFRFRLV